MSSKIPPTPVIFQGGSYGSYLIWLSKMMFGDEKLYSPFDLEKGNSHNTKLQSINIYQWLIDRNRYHHVQDFIKVHPKNKSSDSLESNVRSLTDYFGRSILIYPSQQTYLLHSNNFVYKIWDNLWSGPLAYMNVDNLYDNFPVDRSVSLSDVPKYIVREWLSFNFFNSMNSQIEWYLPDRFTHTNCLILYIDELLYDLENTLNKIKNFLQLPYTKDIKCILPYHKENLSAQKFLTQDQLATNIINSVQNHQLDLCWKAGDLTIITEAWIEQWLRQQGYHFKNFQLDNFPTSTAQLVDLL